MQPAERDLLLMVLAVAAGSADAWSYFGVSHSFVANMTGNTVLIGVALVKQNGDLVPPLISVASYAVGVIAGAVLTRRVKPEVLWSKAVSWTLLAESALIAASAISWAMLSSANAGSRIEHHELLGCLALAIGMQSGAMLRMRIPGVVTTYITGTWTNLMSGLARMMTREAPESKSGKKKFEERLLLQGGVLASYLLSAMVAGWLLGHLPEAAGALTVSAVFFAAIYGLVRS